MQRGTMHLSSRQTPVEVFCRLKPNVDGTPSIRKTSETTITLETPEDRACVKRYTCTFKYVFDAYSTQTSVFERVGLPLVRDVLQGKPALLFTYGVTSSGKTYTMTGKPEDCGLLPRCLDVIFNSIEGKKAVKYVFKPDRLNGFDVQSTVDALQDQQTAAINNARNIGSLKTPKAKRRDDDADREWLINRCPDDNFFAETDLSDDSDDDESSGDRKRSKENKPDIRYAVFISFVQIYNNNVYDLLDEPVLSGKLQSKIIREDSKKRGYVFNAQEIEVSSANEAIELWCKGRRQRRVGKTELNAESSRSHSIFNIRVVQGPVDPRTGDVCQDKNYINVAQLSLVDLAGSERAIRTKNEGDRLREAGSINNSLMSLRQCLQVLRDNQKTGSNQMVPYRASSLTKLFKSFFEGEGRINMLVCVNPRADECDETMLVMQFAEATSEVMIPRAQAPQVVLPPRRNVVFQDPLPSSASTPSSSRSASSVDVHQPYVFTSPADLEFPPLEVSSASDIHVLERIENFLEARMATTETQRAAFCANLERFRMMLAEAERDARLSRENERSLATDMRARLAQITDLERKMAQSETRQKTTVAEMREVERKLGKAEHSYADCKNRLNRLLLERRREREEMNHAMEQEKRRWRSAMERALADKEAHLSRKDLAYDQKLKVLRDIINSNEFDQTRMGAPNRHTPVMTRSRTRSETHPQPSTSRENPPPPQLVRTPTSIPIVNKYHRRSKSQGEIWLEHKPVGNLELDTVLQPNMKKRRSVSKLNMKDITEKTTKYVLEHQEQDSAGDIETQLFKADVLPTATGGASVVISDVETLKQTSPSRLRKRNVPSATVDVEETMQRCGTAIEGHPYMTNVIKRTRN